MRFDEYLQRQGVSAVPLDRFDGFEVDVDGPPDWEAVESSPGMRIWIWPDDPYREQFCANAVLTMHRVTGPLDPVEVFSMLCDEQVHSVRGCQERYRAWDVADDGIGIKGMLSLQFAADFGAVGSASQTRIIPCADATLIAQLTLTALLGSPGNAADVRLSVAPSDSVAGASETVAGRPADLGRAGPMLAHPTSGTTGGDR